MQANCIIQSIGKQKDRVESGRETIIVFEREKKKKMEMKIDNILPNYARYGIEMYPGVGTR